MKTLMAFSGGSDTSTLAYMILKETDDELTLFNMNLTAPGSVDTSKPEDYEPNYARRIAINRSEQLRMPVTLAWLRGIRDFEFIQEEAQPPVGKSFQCSPYWSEAALAMVSRDTYDRFISGGHMDEIGNFPDKIDTTDRAYKAASMPDLYAKWETKTEIPWERPYQDMNWDRDRIAMYMPKGLWNLCSPCIYPLPDGSQCGECNRCLHVRTVHGLV